jgi:fatty-acyl-CoA synthase
MTTNAEDRSTIPRMLLARRRDAGHKPAVVDDSGSLDYAALAELSLRVAAHLVEMGIERGDRVAVLMPPGIDWAAVHYGCIFSGAIVVPMNLSWQSDELSYALRHARPRAIFASAQWRGRPLAERVDALAARFAEHDQAQADAAGFGFLRYGVLFGRTDGSNAGWRQGSEMLRSDAGEQARRQVESRVARMLPRESCAIVYTSGSSGRPKPALLHHEGLLHASLAYADSIALQPDDRILVPWPTFHVSGISAGMMVGHVHALPSWLMEFYEPGRALDLIERESLTAFSGFDTTFATMLSHPAFSPARVATVRRLMIATGPAMFDRVFKAFPSLQIASKCYAMTETCGPTAVAYPSLSDARARKYSQGIAVPGASFRIVDPATGLQLPAGERGEIRLKGPMLFNGYFEMPDATRDAFSEGWFRTGDLGSLSADGPLYLEGRLKRMIKTGGENVSEREVEIFLEDAIDGVNLAQVVGIPDPRWGEAVVAFVELRDGRSLTESELRERCRSRIADFKIPKRIWFVRDVEWPRNDVGKISKDALVALALERSK